MAENSSYRRYLRRVRRKEDIVYISYSSGQTWGFAINQTAATRASNVQTAGGGVGTDCLVLLPLQVLHNHKDFTYAPCFFNSLVGTQQKQTHKKERGLGLLKQRGEGASTCLLHPHEHDPVYDVEAYSNGEHRCRK